jgi:methylated-DNA-[protein]-cysteine S-methyltransferase
MEVGMTTSITTIVTEAGPLTVAVDADGAVVAAGFRTDAGTLLPDVKAVTERKDLGPVTAAVLSYLDGDLAAIDGVAVRQHTGGEFLAHAWDVLREVKPGDPVTYTELAARAGRPDAVRAAAQACARNRVALFVPCHRVIRTDGTLGGYRWGLPVKEWLLAHESPMRTGTLTG